MENRSHTNKAAAEMMISVKTKADWRLIVKDREEGEKGDRERIEFYNDHAEDYNHDTALHKFYGPDECAKVLHKYLNGDLEARILDVAAGTGKVMEKLRKYAPYENADGLDAAGKMLDIAKEKGYYKQTFAQYFVLGTGLPHSAYDFVSCCAGFVPNHLKAETVKEMVDLAKPRGHIIIAMGYHWTIEDPDLQQLKPMIQEMIDAGKIKMVEEYRFDNYYTTYGGLIMVMQKS